MFALPHFGHCGDIIVLPNDHHQQCEPAGEGARTATDLNGWFAPAAWGWASFRAPSSLPYDVARHLHPKNEIHLTHDFSDPGAFTYEQRRAKSWAHMAILVPGAKRETESAAARGSGYGLVTVFEIIVKKC